MGETSKIAWTNGTFNPVEGCEHASPGCDHCYAEARDLRWHPVKGEREEDGHRRLVVIGSEHWGPGSSRLLHTDTYWRQPLSWNRDAAVAGERRRIFCGSLCDVAEDHPDWIGPRARLIALIAATPWLDWLLLTKRPQNYLRLFAAWGDRWPANVWAGCTTESQTMADERIPHLLRVPTSVRFLSVEPQLEAVDLRCLPANLAGSRVDYFSALSGREWDAQGAEETGPRILPRVHWVICGGESGVKARAFDLAWARSLRYQCRAAGVPFFMKQIGALAQTTAAEVGGSPGGPLVWPTHHRAGADPSEWPADLRVQEIPTP